MILLNSDWVEGCSVLCSDGYACCATDSCTCRSSSRDDSDCKSGTKGSISSTVQVF